MILTRVARKFVDLPEVPQVRGLLILLPVSVTSASQTSKSNKRTGSGSRAARNDETATSQRSLRQLRIAHVGPIICRRNLAGSTLPPSRSVLSRFTCNGLAITRPYRNVPLPLHHACSQAQTADNMPWSAREMADDCDPSWRHVNLDSAGKALDLCSKSRVGSYLTAYRRHGLPTKKTE